MQNKKYKLLSFRYFLSIIFIVSSVVKIYDPTNTVLMIHQLFNLSYEISKNMAYVIAISEIGLVILIWQPKIPKFLISIPVIFLIIKAFSFFQKINCGCFGSLPFLSQLPLNFHFALLATMFICFTLLIWGGGRNKEENVNDVNKIILYFSEKTTIVSIFIFCAIITLLLSSLSSSTKTNTSHVELISKQELEIVIKKKEAFIIDSRLESQFKTGHIRGAHNIPYYIKEAALVSLINLHSLRDKFVIVYCSNIQCNAGTLLIRKLRILGCKKLLYYAGGWKEWNNK